MVKWLTRRHLIPLGVITAVGASAATASPRSMTPQEPQGSQDIIPLRFKVDTLEEQHRAVKQLDLGMQMMGDILAGEELEPGIEEGMRVWEQLDEEQKLSLLRAGAKVPDDPQVIPTWAVAAVGAAGLIYEVGKDYNWWGTPPEPEEPCGCTCECPVRQEELDFAEGELRDFLQAVEIRHPGDLRDATALDYTL